jgi:hypothetical protein
MNDEDVAGQATDELAVLQAHADRLQEALEIRNREAAALLVQAELKLEAMRAGMIDLDCLKMINPEEIKLGPDGEALGLPALMGKLRRDKPWLFGVSTSSSAAAAPASAPPKRKLATEMSMDEWRAARAELLRRR